ncbi:MAG: amidase [Solirubrobacteraceae bacterium]
MDDLLFRPVTKLAGMVRAGEISAAELVGASLDRIDALEPQINAFTHVAHEQARADAAAIAPGDPRPFAGVPIAIKDNRAVAGMPLSFCSDLFAGNVADHDTFFVARLRRAGFVIVGKTAMPEAGILPTCESRANGPTNNPWDLTRTPGGSSGGSAAALAAGMVPVAHGNDGGGSTRIPAACCGLVGLKPARARVSSGPDAGQSFLVADGVLTRTVAETAVLLDLLAGYELGDANWAPPPRGSFEQAASGPPAALRVALTVAPALDGAVLDPACERAARDAALLLQSLGHQVEEIPAPWAGRDLLPDFSRAFGPQVATMVDAGRERLGRAPASQDVEPMTWLMYERALAQDTLTYLGAQARLERVAREIVVALAPYDVVVTPALAQRPLRTGEVHGRGPDPAGHFTRSGHFTPYTAIVNVTGQPAISLPLYQGADGLPLAVQLIARPAREDLLLALAAQLERALPWAQRRPSLART